jgi:glycosyltransferase involved in cell wall biosynthesis
MRVGVNALYFLPGGVGGTEIYLRSLLKALAQIDSTNEYFVFTNRETRRGLVPQGANFHERRQLLPAAFRPLRILWEQSVLPMAASISGIDVLFNPGFTAPVVCSCPQVTVFHDLQHKRHPEYFRWFDLPFWNLLLRASARVSRQLISVSEATQRDLLLYYEADSTVIPLAADPEFFDIAAMRAPEPFLLCVSTLHPHKNIDGLLKAFAPFRQQHPEFSLVLAGMKGFYTRQIEALVQALGIGKAVGIPGWMERNDLLDLYRRCHAFVYPSRFEGFGIPPLEAMAAGIPTACSGIAPLTVIADDAALFFPPDNIGPALERICYDQGLRTRLIAAGPERARQFSWQRTAAETLAVLRSAARRL